MAPLSIKQALDLYCLIAPYLPEQVGEGISVVDYVRQVVEAMEDRRGDFADTVSLMTGLSLPEIAAKMPEEILDLFINGLVENQILHLQKFGKSLGVNYAAR